VRRARIGSVCRIDGCGRQRVARERCNRHYKQWRKSGCVTPRPRRVHGESGRTVEYFLWNNMSRAPEGRCESWVNFDTFITDMGRRPAGSRLLRMETSEPFGPNNCFWSSNKVVHGITTRLRQSEAKRKRIVVNRQTLFKCGGGCGEFLPKSSFYSSKKNVNGIRSLCKTCHRSVVLKTRDPQLTRENNRRHEARRRSWKMGTEPTLMRVQEIELERLWGGRCLQCGSDEKLTWDHVVPLSRGGQHSLMNLQRLCRQCNARKATRVVDYRCADQVGWAIRMETV
jgi:5-methylcytosine-specific restriction endonuclease McrA